MAWNLMTGFLPGGGSGERWQVTKHADGNYAFSVRQTGLPFVMWIMAVLTFWSVIVPIVFILVSLYRGNVRYKFTVGRNGFTVGGNHYPLDRINEIEIRNQAGEVLQHSGPAVGFIGSGAGGYAMAGVAAGGAALVGGMQRGMARNGYSLAIQVGSRHIALAKNLKDVHVRGLYADVLRAIEDKL